MRKFFVFILSISLMVAFSGCATLSKNECLEADWFEIGRRDGIMGKPRALFQRHTDACLKHGVNPDRDGYYEGREEGLKFYCTEDNGFKQGRLGNEYQYVCPPEFEPDFLAGYVKGSEIHEYESKIASLERRLERIDSEIKKKESKLYSSEVSSEQKAEIRSEVRSLDLEYREISRELRYLEKTGPI
jgi:hypothetical protein